MKLLLKFNVIFLAVFVLGIAVAAWVSDSFLKQNARQQVIDQAKLMMQTSMATRSYTEKNVRPLLKSLEDFQVFHPEWVPSYGAMTVFRFVQAQYPEYAYKETALNPTNLRDRPEPWEAEIVNWFRNHPKEVDFVGERDTPAGRSLYLAKPIGSGATCAECHSTPAIAPAAMIRQYGTENGFQWQTGETVGAQIVSVPMSLPLRKAREASDTLMLSLLAVAACILLALNVLLILTVIRPVTRMSAAAIEISKGNLDVRELPVSGRDEISDLADSFNRMHRSLSKAMKMLEAE